jgi:glycosyltransferase involved in cell wall biosynthesis
VVTLAPFYPSLENETSGCFIAEPLLRLARGGITSTVFAVEPLYRTWKHASESAPARWMRYVALPGTFGLASAGKPLFVRVWPELARLNQQRRVDLIHAHAALPCGHAAALLSRRLGIPFVVTVHGLDVFNTCLSSGAAAGRRKGISKEIYKAAAKVICVSERIQHILVSELGSEVRSTMIYNGTDVEIFSPGDASEPAQPTILMVGNLLPIKGQDLVLRAMSALRPNYPEVGCRVIGEGADRERLQGLARTLGIDDQVQFLGRRSRAEVAEAMRKCTIFALPSRYEGLGCVYLEAMACGKSVIACHGQGIAEIIQHGRNGWLVKENSVEELIEAIRTLLTNDDLRAQMGKQARQTISGGLTLEHQAERMMQVFDQSVSPTRHA